MALILLTLALTRSVGYAHVSTSDKNSARPFSQSQIEKADVPQSVASLGSSDDPLLSFKRDSDDEYKIYGKLNFRFVANDATLVSQKAHADDKGQMARVNTEDTAFVKFAKPAGDVQDMLVDRVINLWEGKRTWLDNSLIGKEVPSCYKGDGCTLLPSAARRANALERALYRATKIAAEEEKRAVGAPRRWIVRARKMKKFPKLKRFENMVKKADKRFDTFKKITTRIRKAQRWHHAGNMHTLGQTQALEKTRA